MQTTKTSSALILLAFFLLSINLLMSYFVYDTVRELKYDARIINQMGIIRGSIQRIVKLELANELDAADFAIKYSENLIEQFINSHQQPQFSEGKHQVDLDNINQIKESWLELKKLLLEHRSRSSYLLVQRIIQVSENSWNLSDNAVAIAQMITEDKVSGIRIFYVLVFAYTLNILAIIWIVYTYVRKKLEFKASYDSLTKLLNRHSYEHMIYSQTERSTQQSERFTLILFDVDHFKSINDHYGHKIGDIVLVSIAEVVLASIRESDNLFRIGGDEFAIILPRTRMKEAKFVAEKILSKIHKHSFVQDIQVTISIGLDESSASKNPTEIYKTADKALYKAKTNGRDRVQLSSD